MPLPYTTSRPLTIPPEDFNADGLLALVLHGTRDAEDVWTFNLHPATSATGRPADALKTVFGSLRASIADTDERDASDLRASPDFRDRAMESALLWLIGETRTRGWRLATAEDKTEIIAEQHRPALIIANVVLANETFQPMPGATLLDERITGGTPADPAR